jgi:GT2 family glycosyltransferase
LPSGSNLLFRILTRFVSLVTVVGDGVRRVRYRRADLQRISPVEMISDRPSLREAFRWLPAVRLRGRAHVALRCDANSRVTYDVTLPSSATVVSSCTLASEAADQSSGGVEFEISVRTPGVESAARCLVSPSRFGRRWRSLRVHTHTAGPARIVLTTRSSGNAPAADLGALWGTPRIEAPRSVAELWLALRSAMSLRNMRGLWHSAFRADADSLYKLWVREKEPSRRVLSAQRQSSLGKTRTFSLVTFVAEPADWSHRRTAASVLQQTYPGWEWLLVATEDSRQDLSHAVARIGSDQRIRVLSVPSGSTRAHAWNCALHEARGEFAALLGERDVLAPAALYEMASALEPACDVLYSDEDCVSHRHLSRHTPRFKPDWSPELLLSSDYIGRLALLRVSAVIAVGGFRDLAPGAEEWDLVLRLSRSSPRVRRLPRCLYHRDDTAVSSADDQAEAVVQDHCQQLGLQVATPKTPGQSRVTWNITGQPTVSIVIPNRNAFAVLGKAVRGLCHDTSYPHRELVIVDNGSTDPEVLELYRSLERDGFGRIVPFDRPFNFSAACNAGAAAARGDFLLFLNNDIEVIQPDWLDELVRWAQRPDVGIVGGKLLYPDLAIQHAGVVFGLGLVGHIFARAPEGISGLFGSTESYRNYLAVTGACQMMRREVFRQLGGYDERFRLSFSDVVLCLEAWKAGYRVVYTPYARLVHHESYTRKREDSSEDMELLARYLRTAEFVEDPYLHPELDARSLIPALRPPFDPMPSQIIRAYVDRVLAAATPQSES